MKDLHVVSFLDIHLSVNLKKLRSLLFLFFQTFFHFTKKFLFIRGRHKREFVEAYREDHIFSISQHHRFNFPDYSRCYYCKLCDTHCPELINNPNFLAPSYVVGSFSRSLTDFRFFDDRCTDCQDCSDVCPQNIPIKELIHFILEGKKQSA